jgi:putative nucleotidyltransferase with HDIG domain
MSSALDLTEGQEPGHTVRTCIIGMRLAEELDLSSFDRVALYGALLLKDSGCSGNSHRVAEVLNGESPQRPRPALSESRGVRERLSLLLRRSAPGAAASALTRGQRGEGIALRIGFSTATGEAIRGIDEHWDGSGGPDGLVGHEIPLFSRIILLAQSVDAYYSQRGILAAMKMARERSGEWFDPSLARIVRSWREEADWWESLRAPEATQLALSLEPRQYTRYVDDNGLDEVARAFAEIIDSKSPFTYQHSTNVAKYARAVAYELGFEKQEVRVINRAALLHDVGKLGVPTRILDKAGPLTPDERAEMQRHPLYTWEILQPVGAFAGFARTAALHHEKLDGSGYPWGVGSDDLDLPARILCVADMYEALTAHRPYRAGLGRETALKIIREGSGKHVCPVAAEALSEATRHLKTALVS